MASGVKVCIEPEGLEAAQLVFPTGRVAYFRFGNLDVNPCGAADIARDKRACAYFLDRAGLPAPASIAVARGALASADFQDQLAGFVAHHGWPLIVKPNSLYEGRGVEKVDSFEALRHAVGAALCMDKLCLIQPFYPGRDVRLVVFDGIVVAAYSRVPPAVTGDGRRDIAALLDEFASDHEALAASRLDLVQVSERLQRRQGGLTRIPEIGELVTLADAANFAQGSRLVDLTDTLPSVLRTLALDAARVAGLRLAGVDLIVDTPMTGDNGVGRVAYADTDWPAERSSSPVILEVNAAPELEGVAHLGPQRRAAVDQVFGQILAELAGGSMPSLASGPAQPRSHG
jgi:cyanophycin synthetase